MQEINTRRAMTDEESIAERERRTIIQRQAFAAVDKAFPAVDKAVDLWPSPPAVVVAAPAPAPAPAENILQERGKTHGDFSDNARITQALKAVMRDTEGSRWSSLSPVQHEALEMIALKLGRLLSGDSNYIDHWSDVAGYAQLVVERL